ncbi:Oidioi.mRNA.OKI2018_I69.chr1.g3343.t1.cds [Oikopleura dioica]|uniref:non-specific serine/threonine protein kinase n=1 Tax=Oikopleura dioica TaxID=34765 RepID=A0ABN7STV0_OIKDI|nr:Oidioi.mRNA.OKI2018_I69.chr1.g3343.t1.cds [Oikopleura dioica]
MSWFFRQSQPGYVGSNVQIGSYNVHIESVLAEGGFSIVYLANAKIPNSKSTKAALKRMFVNDEETLAGCKNEIQVMRKLTGHKNIVRYMAHKITCLKNGTHEVLVLIEYCSRGHVLDFMNKRLNSGFTEEEVMKIFCDVVEAVAKMHQSNPPFAHRDLKVENVLIHDSGRYVLCDFGSASSRILEPDKNGVSTVEEEITKFTTVQYRSPEMVDLYSGFPIGPKSDIWALGVLLYHLCFFNLPFSTTLSIQTGEISVPDNSPFSVEIHRIIQFCLTVDVQRRPDIWQLAEAVFAHAKRQNPVHNRNNSPSIDLLTISPLMNATQLAQFKEDQRRQQKDASNQQNQQGNFANATIAPRQRPNPKRPPSPKEMVNRAESALQILQKQMADIKVTYAQLPATDSRRIKLENDAATIKIKYQKILDLRNENRSRLANSSSTTFNPSQQSANFRQNPPRAEIPPPKIPPKIHQGNAPEIHTNHHLTHRRVLSDPSTIQEIQSQQLQQQRQNQMASSQTFTTGLSAFQQPVIPDQMSSFASDSTIDSVSTVRLANSPSEKDDDAFDAFLEKRKNLSDAPTNFKCEKGPVYQALYSNGTSESQPETNGGWVKDPEDTDDSSSVSDSSESRSVKSDSEDADALIDSSDDDFPQVRQMRSQTCPNLSDSVNLALNREEDPFSMAPFPAAAIPPQIKENDPWGDNLPQSRPPISKTNPFRMGAFSGPLESSNDADPFNNAPFPAT